MGRPLRSWAGLAALPLLAGCGFTPMYARTGLTPALAAIKVEPPDHSRPGYLMQQQLDDALGRDLTVSPAYRLVLTVSLGRFPLGVRINNVASRYEIDLNVVWILKDAKTGKEITRGGAVGRTSYDSGDAPYSGVAAEQDGEERAASEAAVRIRYGLGRWFALHPPGSDAGGPPTAAREAQIEAQVAPSPAAEAARSLTAGTDGVPDAAPPLDTSVPATPKPH